MMNTLLSMGAAGSSVLLLWLLLSRTLGERLPARWYYRMLKASLFFLLIPVGRLAQLLERAASALTPVSAPAASPGFAGLPVSSGTPAITLIPTSPSPAPPSTILPETLSPIPLSLSAGASRLLTVFWIAGAASVLVCKAFVGFRLHRRVFRQNRRISSREVLPIFRACKRQLGIRRPVELRENPLVRSPLAAGLLRPMVVIPASPFSGEELRCMFLHELTHIRSGDLWIRLASLSALALHWYNPLVHLLCRSIRTLGEQNCDERVVLPLSGQERYAYGNTVMKLAVNVAAGGGDWAVPLSAGEELERRLFRVLHTEKLKGSKRLLALSLAGALLACGAAAALAVREPLPLSDKTPVPVSASARPAGDTAASVSDDILNAVRAAWASSGVTAETPVLFGDRALILSRGGTLLPDDDPASYCLTDGILYKQFLAKTGREGHFPMLPEYAVGNAAMLNGCDPQLLETLVNGEYPKNSGGESYGSDLLAGYVGYEPDLTAAAGGYIRESELPGASVSSPEEARAYMAWRSENPGPYAIPLYDAEGTVIGSFQVGGGGGKPPADASAASPGPDAPKDAIAAAPEDRSPAETAKPTPPSPENQPGGSSASGEPEPASPAGTESSPSVVKSLTVGGVTITIGTEPAAPDDLPSNPFSTGEWADYIDTALRGDPDLIRSRGGTLLPDDEKTSYIMINGVMYKEYLDKNGQTRPEYAIGNQRFTQELYLRDGDLSPLEELTNGVYPENESGESYGDNILADYVGYAPDLILSDGENGSTGYSRVRDQSVLEHGEGDCLGQYSIPLYASDGKTVIGAYTAICRHLL